MKIVGGHVWCVVGTAGQRSTLPAITAHQCDPLLTVAFAAGSIAGD